MTYDRWYGMDTENDSDGVVTLCALVNEEGGHWIWHKAGEFKKWIDTECKDKHPVCICHNLEYDLVNEFGAEYPYLSLNYLKGRLISAKYGKMNFLDSFNHYRMALVRIGKAFGIEKLKFDIYDENYVLNDARIPLAAMTFTRDYVEQLGGRIGATAGSTAMSVWEAMEGKEFFTGPFDDAWLRAGYYGGRTEIFRAVTHGRPNWDGQETLYTRRGVKLSKARIRRAIETDDALLFRDTGSDKMNLEPAYHADIKGYDVNSMYPACMLNEFPMMHKSDPTMEKRKGMAEITIKVPLDLNVAPLPHRDKNQRLLYPVGTFRGIWTYDEIRYAETLGAKVLKVHKAIGSSYCERPFDKFVMTIYHKRRNSENPAEREVLKVLMNSLYGKLASRNTITRTVSRWSLIRNKSKNLDKVKWIDGHRGLLDFTTPSQPYVNVLWGAMITAFARIHLTKYLTMAPPESLAYCDTDSMYVLDHDLPLTEGLGGMKLERTGRLMEVLQPKAYRLDEFYKAKGVPKPKYNDDGSIQIDFAKGYMEDGITTFEAPIRFRASLRRDSVVPNQWVKTKRTRKTAYVIKTLSGQRYLPPVVGTQMELAI